MTLFDFACDAPPTCQSTTFEEKAFVDYVNTVDAVAYLQYAAQQWEESNHTRPFFLGLGVTKPHATWHVPDEFYQK